MRVGTVVGDIDRRFDKLSGSHHGICLLFNFTQIVILENLTIVDLALSGLKGLRCLDIGLLLGHYLPILVSRLVNPSYISLEISMTQ